MPRSIVSLRARGRAQRMAKCSYLQCTSTSDDDRHTQLIQIIKIIDSIRSPYSVSGWKAAQLQGVSVTTADTRRQEILISVQWDYFNRLHSEVESLTRGGSVCPLITRGAVSHFKVEPYGVLLFCRSGTFVAADNHRVCVKLPVSGQFVWCRSLLAILSGAEGGSFGSLVYSLGPMGGMDSLRDPDLASDIGRHLVDSQKTTSEHNLLAWALDDAYDAWVQRFGSPSEAALKILEDPAAKLGPLYPHIDSFLQQRVDSGKAIAIANLFGSHGTKAASLCSLDPRIHVTVVDIGKGNARYGMELASAAGIGRDRMQYIITNVLDLDLVKLGGSQDAVLIEMGCLHYITFLPPLMRIVFDIMKPGGRLILRDFHPISTKLISTKGSKQKVDGDYFHQGLHKVDVAYSKQLAGDGREKLSVSERRWTLGEIITSISSAGLKILLMEEEGGVKGADQGVPKTFIIVCERV